MGLLDKIFNSDNTKASVVDELSKSDVAPTEKYRKKYEQMEAEGKRISWYEYRKTVDEGWPYPVATEAEMDHIQRSNCQVLRGHAPDVLKLVTHYVKGLCEDSNDPEITIYKDSEKAEYWKEHLINGAAKGNRAYQGALITTNGMGGKINGWISEDEFNLYESMYKNNLLNDAASGNPNAQYAVAEFCLGDAVFKSELRKQYAEEAMKAGITDAAFLLDVIYQLEAYENGGEWGFDDKVRVYLHAADNSSGSMLGWIQDCVADAYMDGDGGLTVDKDKALYYYTLAASNGSSTAKSTLELFRDRPDLLG